MNLLFIAMQVHGQHAFIGLWAKAFVARGYSVDLLVQEGPGNRGVSACSASDPTRYRIYSLGKENGRGKRRQALRFCRLVGDLDYERVFIYGTPEWGLLGSWYWIPRRVPTYLWYTHYAMHPSLWVTGRFAKRLFCATAQSLPQYDHSPKKVVTGHGIDLSHWAFRPNAAEDPYKLLCVHRLSPSKRVELLVRALRLLPSQFTLDIYGDELDTAYVLELQQEATQLGVANRLALHGSAPSSDLPTIYRRHRLILNMAPETIDKTMLEAMTCGCYPVVTKRNAAAIGLRSAPADDPESIAAFVLRYFAIPPISAEEMYRLVAERHSLQDVIACIDSYMRPGC